MVETFLLCCDHLGFLEQEIADFCDDFHWNVSFALLNWQERTKIDRTLL